MKLLQNFLQKIKQSKIKKARALIAEVDGEKKEDDHIVKEPTIDIKVKEAMSSKNHQEEVDKILSDLLKKYER